MAKKICFFCNKNEDGVTEGEYVDYNPCQKCKEVMDNGITFIAVDEMPILGDEQPPIVEVDEKPLYPTGHYVILKQESFDRIFKDNKNTEQIKKDKNVVIMIDEFLNLFGDILKDGGKTEYAEYQDEHEN